MAQIVPFVVITIWLLAMACGPVPGQVPKSDSGYRFQASENTRIPTDNNIYTITGEVVGDVNSLTRQTERATGGLVGIGGYVSGSYFGPEFEGKGFVRLHVQTSDSPLAPPESVAILKMTDTKGIMLLPGDMVTLKCRAQYEAVASIYAGEPFDQERFQTWELDYCRLAEPTVSK